MKNVMKRPLKVIAAAAFMVALGYGCDHREEFVQPSLSYKEKITNLEQMYASSFKHLNQEMSSFVINKTRVDIDERKLFNSTSDFLNKNYVTKGKIELNPDDFNLSKPYSISSSRGSYSNAKNRISRKSLENQLTDVFGKKAGTMLFGLVEQLMQESNLKNVPDIIDDFYTEVIYSSLTEDDKIQLLSAGSGIKSLAVFFSKSRNLKHLKNSLFSKRSKNASSITLSQLSMMSGGSEGESQRGGCEVNWRNVWAGGVTAGFIGGAFGLKTGCA